MIAADDILEFWFEASGPKKWFKVSDAFDAEIRRQFEDLCIESAAQLRQKNTHKWQNSPNSILALIICLDQFPRNMYRGTKGAFAFDDLGLQLAQHAVKKRYDLKIDQLQRPFIYMPYMHSEDLAMQDECVRLMESRLKNESNLFHAQEHRKTIARFGRFPHRNTIIGRQSSQEEIEYLEGGGYTP